MKVLKLCEAAKLLNVNEKTLQRWDRLKSVTTKILECI